jgi:hypothetical protein
MKACLLKSPLVLITLLYVSVYQLMRAWRVGGKVLGVGVTVYVNARRVYKTV